MTHDGWRAVTVNLGGAGPTASRYSEASLEWAKRRVDAYDVVFAQEIPDDTWLDEWREAGFAVVESVGPRFRPRSAVILRRGLVGTTRAPSGFLTANYHGSYVAAVEVKHPALGWVVLMSVHASPNRVTPEWEAKWKECGALLPWGRPSCGLWDADLVLESVRMVAASGLPVIAAGDWNEARGWDHDHPRSAGAEFFHRVTEAGLTDCCCEGGEERATHGVGAEALCLDHVLATGHAVGWVAITAVANLDERGPADHRPVGFTIRTSG